MSSMAPRARERNWCLSSRLQQLSGANVVDDFREKPASLVLKTQRLLWMIPNPSVYALWIGYWAWIVHLFQHEFLNILRPLMKITSHREIPFTISLLNNNSTSDFPSILLVWSKLCCVSTLRWMLVLCCSFCVRESFWLLLLII